MFVDGLCNAFISFIRSGPVATTLFLIMLLLVPLTAAGCFGEECDVEDDDDDDSVSSSIAIFFPP